MNLNFAYGEFDNNLLPPTFFLIGDNSFTLLLDSHFSEYFRGGDRVLFDFLGVNNKNDSSFMFYPSVDLSIFVSSDPLEHYILTCIPF